MNKISFNQLISILLLVLVSICCFLRVSDRNNVYQECDSSFVYDSINDYPNSAMLYTAGTLRDDKTIIRVSKELAISIIESKVVSGLLDVVIKDYPKEQLIRVLTAGDKSLLFFIRGAVIAGTMAIKDYLPYPILAGISVAMSSTYSFGAGSIYALLAGKQATYAEFMNSSLIITVILFHLSIIGLFFILKTVGLASVTSFMVSAVALFSISLSSYGFHLGSTVWNFSTCMLFIWSVIILKKNWPLKYMGYISIIAAFLILFNYLIIFFWFACIIDNILTSRKELNLRTSFNFELYAVFKSQIPVFISIIVAGLLFYTPGQKRGGDFSTITEILTNLYYIILNIFSIYNHNDYIDMLQFMVSVVFVSLGLVSCAKNVVKRHNHYFKRYLFIIFIVIAILYVAGLSGIGPSFGPSRQILFIGPVLFLLFAVGIDEIIFQNTIYLKCSMLVCVVIVAYGLLYIAIRSDEMKDKTNLIRVEKRVSQIFIEGCHYQLLHKNWGPGRSAILNSNKENQLVSNNTYLLISQDLPNPMDKIIKKWINEGNDIEIIDYQLIDSGIRFLAYSPRLYPWDRQSGFEAVTFHVKPSS